MVAVENHRSAGRSDQSHDRLAQGRLPHAVAPDDRHRLGSHREGEPVEDRRLAIPGLEHVDLEQWVGHQSSPGSPR